MRVLYLPASALRGRPSALTARSALPLEHHPSCPLSSTQAQNRSFDPVCYPLQQGGRRGGWWESKSDGDAGPEAEPGGSLGEDGYRSRPK
jgi:hypothetical protein